MKKKGNNGSTAILAVVALIVVAVAVWLLYKNQNSDDTPKRFIFDENGKPITDPQKIEAFIDKMNAVRGNTTK